MQSPLKYIIAHIDVNFNPLRFRIFHRNAGFAIEFIQDVKFVHLFCYVADEEVDIVLCDVQIGVTEEF